MSHFHRDKKITLIQSFDSETDPSGSAQIRLSGVDQRIAIRNGEQRLFAVALAAAINGSTVDVEVGEAPPQVQTHAKRIELEGGDVTPA